MPFHFINPSKPLGFGYKTYPQDLTNTIRRTLINEYTRTKLKILEVHIDTQFHELHSLNTV